MKPLARKYGDCKDKASLLVGDVAVRIFPRTLLFSTLGSREDVAPDLPGMGMFDHAIVYVPGPPDLWIDATDEYAGSVKFPTPIRGGLPSLCARQH